MLTADIQLSLEQQEVFDAIAKGEVPRIVTVGGFAGTGKSELIVRLAAATGYAVCAYTNKAAYNLQQRGCKAQSIHSLFYYPIDQTWERRAAEKRLEQILEGPSADSRDVRAAEEWIEELKKPCFILKELDDLVDGDGNPFPGFLVDEASMISRSLYEDMISFGLPIVFVGDHGQLGPVTKDGDNFNLMANPDYRLETLHRNAGPIALFAQHLRTGGSCRDYPQCDVVQFVADGEVSEDLILTADQIICHTNATRVHINALVRKESGRRHLLEAGDRILAWHNSRREGIFNGMQGTVLGVDLSLAMMDFLDDCGNLHENVAFDPEAMGAEYPRYQPGGARRFTYGYAISCHKAQGSEWGHVVVVDDYRGKREEYTRWAYTAASRAKERVTWIYR
jgi:exodeoxyribonuclease-5